MEQAMTPLVPIMMFGWVPLTVILFLTIPPRTAVLCSVIGGVLFLPMTTYDLPGFPEYSKTTAIALGLLLGGLLSGNRGTPSFHWQRHDLPMALWCFLCPVATSLANDLGLYDGLSGALQFYLGWGVFYWAGRRYFAESSSLGALCRGIILGGLLYVPLCLFELRMSPQLSNIFYGFFPHSWVQHVRYGGYRPVVFMQHGLMVALWMSLSFTVAFWLWRSKRIIHMQGIPMGFLVLSLLIVAIYCRSANGWFFLSLGLACYLYFILSGSPRLFRLLVIAIPLYIAARITNMVPLEYIQRKAEIFFDDARITSLTSRLTQENLFSSRALEHLVWGWGGWDRGWPVDPDTGQKVVRAVDSLWVIIFSGYGIVGLTSLFLAMLIGPLILFGKGGTRNNMNANDEPRCIYSTVLSLVVVFFMIDSLFNGMVNPVYILCAGALISYHNHNKETFQSHQYNN